MKLIIADDHTLFRDALVQYITRANVDAHVDIAEDFGGVVELMNKDPDYDLVLLDLRMPGMSGLDGFKTMNEDYPDTPTALMSGLAEPEDVEKAMAYGAAAYFPKTMSGKALLKAVESVLEGEIFIPNEPGTDDVMPSYRDDGDFAGGKNGSGNALAVDEAMAEMNLTRREGEVLGYLVKGASNKEIANALGLQLVTVKLHVRGICRKLDAKNRTQAALKAQSLGFGQ